MFQKRTNWRTRKTNPGPLETGLSSWSPLYESRQRSRHHRNLPTRRPAPLLRCCCWRGSKWHQGRVESLNHQPRRRNLWRRSPDKKKVTNNEFSMGIFCFWSKGMMMKIVLLDYVFLKGWGDTLRTIQLIDFCCFFVGKSWQKGKVQHGHHLGCTQSRKRSSPCSLKAQALWIRCCIKISLVYNLYIYIYIYIYVHQSENKTSLYMCIYIYTVYVKTVYLPSLKRTEHLKQLLSKRKLCFPTIHFQVRTASFREGICTALLLACMTYMPIPGAPSFSCVYSLDTSKYSMNYSCHCLKKCKYYTRKNIEAKTSKRQSYQIYMII